MIKINYHNVIKLRSVYHEVLPCRCIMTHYLEDSVSCVTLRSVFHDTLP